MFIIGVFNKKYGKFSVLQSLPRMFGVLILV